MPSKQLRSTRGNGSMRERSKGSWQIRYDGPPDAKGKVKKLSETFRGTKREAEKRKRELLGLIDSGDYLDKSGETVASFMQRWLDTYVATNNKPATQRGYEGNIRRYINPAFGNVALQNLQPATIQQLYADMLERGLSATTVLHTHRVLREALNHGIKWGVLARNPADATTPPRPQTVELEMWDVPTIHAFLKAADDHPFRDIFHLAVLTGMRRGELLGLKWEYTNLSEKWLSVASTLQRINGKGLVIGSPKTKKSRRTIALSSESVELLKAVKTRQLEQRLSIGAAWQDNGYVFCQLDGKPLHPDKVSNEFKRIVDCASLPHLSLKGLRHAHATLLFSAGIHPKVVSERLGHSNISITMDIYSHVMPGMQEEAARAIDQRMSIGMQAD